MNKNDTLASMAKQEVFQIRIDSDLKARIMNLASERGISTAALVISTLTSAYPELRRPQQGLAQTLADLQALDNKTPFERLTQQDK